MTEQPVVVERDGAVVTITMNRPERRNALTADLKAELLRALMEAGDDTGVRAVVLAAAGPAFCVGQDLGEHARSLADDAKSAFDTVREHYSPIIQALMTMSKPVVAAVSGTCVGAGLGIALACDLRVFASGVKLATAFTGIGLTFDSGLSYTLPRAVGESRARDLMLRGRTFEVEQAVAWGVSGEVVDSADVLTTAQAIAADLAQGPTVAFAETKQLLISSASGTLRDALDAEAQAQTRCGVTQDHQSAVSAFLAREKPHFVGA
ncbi:enoyl-CoA hydratase/isomerase family protein [Mycobacterium sp.]|uniref:enoyl-CoA hydratase/isomerase family protein n=1 Tax=Mycobacterium sp. TaxID=1785 RepID=UPI002BE6FCE6|nr:enoyl-CoA hydratase-related protein [Mycobacterium sp.]HKP40524.1 enoyl-CoA hydratase-related protein [Mycobacterium sp.]